jgi:hypothetical protein
MMILMEAIAGNDSDRYSLPGKLSNCARFSIVLSGLRI